MEVVTCPVKTIYIPNDIHIFICKNVRKEITNKLKNFKGLCHNVQNATHLIVDRDETIDINVLHAILKGIFVYKEQCKLMSFNLMYCTKLRRFFYRDQPV